MLILDLSRLKISHFQFGSETVYVTSQVQPLVSAWTAFWNLQILERLIKWHWCIISVR